MKKILLGVLLLCQSLHAQKLPFQFDAKALLTLSDADMVASAYGDGQLHAEKGVEDALSILQLGTTLHDSKIATLKVPNSVTNWINALDISKDGQTAFVVDTRLGLPRTVQQVKNVFEDLPAGNTLYAIDIRDLSKPKIMAQTKVGATPLSVSVNPVDGSLLVCGGEAGKEIAVIAWKNGQFGKMVTYAQAGKVTHANWHPSGRHFAVTLENTRQVQFLKWEQGNISPQGNPVTIEGFPGAALWSPNGRYYIVPNLNWDKAYDKAGELVVVNFNEKGQSAVQSKSAVGISPEGIAISPDGRWVASSNMGTTFLPPGLPIWGHQASISLLRFDQESGILTLFDTLTWYGVLPEGIAFDNNADMLAVTSFDYLDLSKRRGGVHFFSISDGKLTNTGFSVSVRRGCHFVRVLR